MYQLYFYVPESHLEQVKNAVFSAGGGQIGDYDQCCWQVIGQGQFRPQPGSDPFIGAQGCLEKVVEYRVEMVCSEKNIAAVIASLKVAHPYEEPAYGVWRLESRF